MSTPESTQKKAPATVTVGAADLNQHGGVFCPNPKADMKLWNGHPRVYLDLAHTGQARCPYCGTVYQLDPSVKLAAGH